MADMKAAWSSAYITALPNSAFACVQGSDRFYPHHGSSGSLDLPHLRAALSRIGDPSNQQCGKAHLEAHAKAAGIGDKSFDLIKVGARNSSSDMGRIQAIHDATMTLGAGCNADNVQQKAVFDVEPIKAEQLTSVKWRVLAIPFGGPMKGGKDLDGEYFSPRTDIKAEWFPTRPVLWNHSKDAALGDTVLGTEDDLEMEPDGWWATMWLDRSARYWEHVSALLSAGKVFGSSGALGHLVQKARDGEILVWPHIEQTLTPTPANPFARVVPAKAMVDFNSAGIAWNDADLPDLDRDLPSGGDDPAMDLLVRAKARASVLAVLARMKDI